MLSEIYIKNYILVPELRLQFEAGLTVISGETGAGKSIIVGSIGLIFGESALGLEAFDAGQAIYLEATFLPATDPELIEYLQQINTPPEEELILAREISVGGKSAYYIGGRKVSAAVMKGLKALLIDFHHQRDQQKLLSSSHQLYLLDRYADTIKLREAFGQSFREIKAQRKTLQNMIRQQNEQKQKLELYRYQHEELEKAALKTGEDTLLEQEYELLNHSLDILELSQSMKQTIFENEDSIFDQLSLYSNRLQSFKNLNPALDNAAQELLEALEALSSVSSSLSEIVDSLAYDPDRLSAIQARLDAINELLHKHKVKNVKELQELFQQRKQEILAMEDYNKSIKELNGKLEKDFKELVKQADLLSDQRQKAAVLLAQELTNSIRQLAMKDAKLQIDIDKKPQLENLLSDSLSAFSESGQDRIQILFSANPGSSLKALAGVASGGELSRILLGIKEVLVAREEPRLLILDEIDAGIGGKTAESVAACIGKIASRHPVFCITHLAQIAAQADTHIAVTKNSDTKTNLTLRVLSKAERTQELARMLSGKLTDAALRHAEELRKL
ncbi:MAG: DNA repair protein RecN [Candidatus Cloacimonetes bacterium]|nr:DNA repair protein RecN [Candidatus Cloacimonadota bacterium]MDY0228765.1 DNA repair protein RecN [Candidatus Cloacimonadaceae bacterium]